jgi:hypothetical protein
MNGFGVDLSSVMGRFTGPSTALDQNSKPIEMEMWVDYKSKYDDESGIFYIDFKISATSHNIKFPPGWNREGNYNIWTSKRVLETVRFKWQALAEVLTAVRTVLSMLDNMGFKPVATS